MNLETGFAARIDALAHSLSPAEQRVAHILLSRKSDAVLSSAARIAEMAGTSDATVVRTARALGFESLTDLREALMQEVEGEASPARRMARTLVAARQEGGSLLDHTLLAHQEALKSLHAEGFEASFEAAVDLLAGAKRLFLFGIGPSSALAQYGCVQFGRLGVDCHALDRTGIGLADQAAHLCDGDVVLMLAYAPIYREAQTVLELARARAAKVILVTDSVGAPFTQLADHCLNVTRGRSNHFALHGATLVLLEALVAGLGDRRGDKGLEALLGFEKIREVLDEDWAARRGRQVRNKQKRKKGP